MALLSLLGSWLFYGGLLFYLWPMKYRRDGKQLEHCYCLGRGSSVEAEQVLEGNDEVLRLSDSN